MTVNDSGTARSVVSAVSVSAGCLVSVSTPATSLAGAFASSSFAVAFFVTFFTGTFAIFTGATSAVAVFGMAGPGFVGAFLAPSLFFEAAGIAFSVSLAGASTAAFFTGAFFVTLRAEGSIVLTGAAFTGANLFATVFLAVAFFAIASSAFAVALFVAQRFFIASEMAFLPAAESFRFGFDGSGVAFDEGLAPVAGGFFTVPEDDCKLIAFFARTIAAFASRSSSRMWGALAEDRSVTFDINASILAMRLRTFFAFMTLLSFTLLWISPIRCRDRPAARILAATERMPSALRPVTVRFTSATSSPGADLPSNDDTFSWLVALARLQRFLDVSILLNPFVLL